MIDFKIIAVDFDGTLCENKWPEIGAPNEELINHLKSQQVVGNKIILWTCREGDLLSDAINWCRGHGLLFDAINENLPDVIREFGGSNRKIFAHEYIDDRNSLYNDLPKREKSSMELWAEKEVEIACKKENPDKKPGEFDYGCACYDSALKAFKCLMGDGHSGFSIGITKQILNRLIDGKPLTPIEDTGDTWDLVSGFNKDSNGLICASYQCKRMSSLFKTVYTDGTVKFSDVNRIRCIDIQNPNNTYHSGLVDRIINEMFPIKMPYYPGKEIKVYCQDGVLDKKNGDFDTVGIFYAIMPDGEKTQIDKFFKESPSDWKEIDETEYFDRLKKRRLKIEDYELDELEDVFGFKFYNWQREYLKGDISARQIGGRGNGKTFAYCLRLLLFGKDGDAFKISDIKGPHPTIPVDERRSFAYVNIFCNTIQGINEKLVEAGWHTNLISKKGE